MTPPEQPARLCDGVHYIPTAFETRLRQLVALEARQQARQAVIRRLKAEGVRVSLMSRAEITRLAQAHLRANAAELLGARKRLARCKT